MARTRISTTVDDDLLRTARRTCRGMKDAALMDEALRSLLARRRAAEIDRAYDAYDDVPAGTADDWGDLESWREAAGSS